MNADNKLPEQEHQVRIANKISLIYLVCCYYYYYYYYYSYYYYYYYKRPSDGGGVKFLVGMIVYVEFKRMVGMSCGREWVIWYF